MWRWFLIDCGAANFIYLKWFACKKFSALLVSDFSPPINKLIAFFLLFLDSNNVYMQIECEKKVTNISVDFVNFFAYIFRSGFFFVIFDWLACHTCIRIYKLCTVIENCLLNDKSYCIWYEWSNRVSLSLLNAFIFYFVAAMHCTEYHLYGISMAVVMY